MGVQKEKLFHIAWRPHPPSLLSQQKQQDIKKNLKQYSRKYDAMDEQAKESARQAFRADSVLVRVGIVITGGLARLTAVQTEEVGALLVRSALVDGVALRALLHEEFLSLCNEFCRHFQVSLTLVTTELKGFMDKTPH